MTETKIKSISINQKAKIANAIKKIGVYVFLGLAILTVLFPFYIAVITSFKYPAEANSIEFSWWPKEFTFNGYKDAITYVAGNTVDMPLLILGFFNTMWIVLPRALVGTIFAGMAGFAYAKLNFRMKSGMFGTLMATMMMPGIITLIPSYLLFYHMGWLNTALPIIAPSLFGGTTAVFFMRQYYMGVPSDMMEAASIDGLGYFGIYFRIMFPVSMPAFWAQFILAFINGYNEYLGPMLYLKDASLITLQLALSQFSTSRHIDPGAVMAAAIIALIPTVSVFIAAQKQFISGIVTSGVKL